MNIRRLAAFIPLILLLCPLLAVGQDLPSIEKKTKDMQRVEGYFTYYVDQSDDKIWLEIDKLDTRFLYVNGLSAGVGSNDIGLDRGQLGADRVVYFDRRGPKVLLVQPNLDYRSSSSNEPEQEAVEEAFAHSVLWGFEIKAQTKERVLIDFTKFLKRDAHDVAGQLEQSDEGTYTLAQSRSALYLPNTKNFPRNSEFEVTLTFTGDNPGNHLRSVVPTPEALTVRQHHSLIQLPDDNYKPRKFHPRSGYFDLSYTDYSTPIDQSITQRYIVRHRLKKKNPDAALSEPEEPIVYYLDPGTPEPVRSALLDGARWWKQAFRAAGYKNAFEVRMLPEDADPMDVRYNVIQWVHRSTRGWSYGASVVDPRTGEIIKGHVTLGSLRVRQDYLIAEGLLAPYDGDTLANDPMQQMALARIRQLSAHEVGHTLGLAHNFAASVNDRASVMDYPHPKVQIRNDSLDLSDAYDTGIGEWDKLAIRYGYQQFPGKHEKQGLQSIIEEGIDEGFQFISDRDARPRGGAHPYAHLWDNGENAVDQMNHILEVRRHALQRFSKNNIRSGTPTALLEDNLVPIYLYHRYQVKAAAKLVGGLHYAYKVKGDRQDDPQIVAADQQQRAIDALLQTVQPDILRMPDRVLDIVPPRPAGFDNTRELFNGYTGVTFDPLGAAESAADLTFRFLLDPQRATRLVNHHARNSEYPGLGELIDRIYKQTWKRDHQSGYTLSLQHTADYAALTRLLDLASDDNAPVQVRSLVTQKLEELGGWMEEAETDENNARHRAMLGYGQKMIDQFMEKPDHFEISDPKSMPPGSPIGQPSPGLQCGLGY